jgi:hypothetical protein
MHQLFEVLNGSAVIAFTPTIIDVLLAPIATFEVAWFSNCILGSSSDAATAKYSLFEPYR